MSEESAIAVRLTVTPSAPPDWDDYVEKHPAATAYHRAAAVAIGAVAFGLGTYYLAARAQAGNLVGVLPLVEQSSLLFGRFLSSVPFFTYGGVLADDPAIAAQLRARAAEIGAMRKARHVELRESTSDPGCEWPVRQDKVSMILALPDGEEALMRAFGSKLRSQIRRADRESPEVLVGGSELLAQFYPIFAENMHELGTPVYSRRFFESALAAFGDRARVYAVRVAGSAQAVAITVRHGHTIEVPWAAATQAAKKASLNMRMYMEMLRGAMRDGAKHFDFGRTSPDSGTYRFKEQWGATPKQLYWYCWLGSGKALPQLNHSNPKYALAARAWRRLPRVCANLAGPWIVRNLP